MTSIRAKRMCDAILEGKDVRSVLQLSESTKVNSAQLVKIAKSLKPNFRSGDLEKAVKAVIKDPAAVEVVVDYLTAVEDDDGMVSDVASGDIKDADAKKWADSMVADLNDQLEEATNPAGSSKTVNEGNSMAMAKELAQCLQGVTTGPKIRDAIKKCTGDEDLQEQLYEYLTEVESEDEILSLYNDGDIEMEELASMIQSFIDDTGLMEARKHTPSGKLNISKGSDFMNPMTLQYIAPEWAFGMLKGLNPDASDSQITSGVNKFLGNKLNRPEINQVFIDFLKDNKQLIGMKMPEVIDAVRSAGLGAKAYEVSLEF